MIYENIPVLGDLGVKQDLAKAFKFYKKACDGGHARGCFGLGGFYFEGKEVFTMRKYFEPEFKKKIVRLHLEDGRTIRSLATEYSISKASISN